MNESQKKHLKDNFHLDFEEEDETDSCGYFYKYAFDVTHYILGILEALEKYFESEGYENVGIAYNRHDIINQFKEWDDGWNSDSDSDSD